MSDRIEKYGLNVDAKLVNFIESEAIPGTGVDVQKFWQGFAEIIEKLGPTNKSLLEKREDIQSKIDQWHITHRGQEIDSEKYKSFLLDIDYLVPEGEDFKIDTSNVDLEIAKLCGPQLVVPIMNARYALNAANARWGSLYDAFYGTDAMGDLPPEGSYSNERGDKVISNAKAHLDKVVPLNLCKWHEISKISILEGQLLLSANGQEAALINKNQFVGHIQNNNSLNEIIFVQNGLHVRIVINPDHVIGKIDRANISDIILEAALTTIMDCEDSVAAVDGEDKVLAYKNWLGLMKGDLTEDIEKAGKNITRRLNSDIEYINTEGTKAILKGRSLMLNRNVGHLMTNPSVLDSSGNEVGEGLIDAMCTIMIAMHDLSKSSGI